MINNNNADENLQNSDDPDNGNADGRTSDSMWELDFDGWTVGEDAMYMYQVSRAQHTGNLKPLFPHWSRMIRQWPYAHDPRNLKRYADLGPEAHQEIMRRIDEGIRLPKRIDGRSGGGET